MEHWQTKVNDHLRYKGSYLYCFDEAGVSYHADVADLNDRMILVNATVSHSNRKEKLIRDAAGDHFFKKNGETTPVTDERVILGLDRLYDEIQSRVIDPEYRPRFTGQLHFRYVKKIETEI